MDSLHSCFFIGSAPSPTAYGPGTESDRRNFQFGISKRSVFHENCFKLIPAKLKQHGIRKKQG
jgi:hypothetical protein